MLFSIFLGTRERDFVLKLEGESSVKPTPRGMGNCKCTQVYLTALMVNHPVGEELADSFGRKEWTVGLS